MEPMSLIAWIIVGALWAVVGLVVVRASRGQAKREEAMTDEEWLEDRRRRAW